MRLDISLRLDALGLTLLTVVTSVSCLVAIYSRDYMRGDAGFARFFAVFCGFVFSMTMLVLANNLLLMYAFWEGVGTCSYLLIGYYYRKPSAAQAAIKAFLVNRVADCAFLFGILLLAFVIGETAAGHAKDVIGRLDFATIHAAADEIAHSKPYPDLIGWIALCFLIGAIGKSAQFPLHVWLPDAMEGPTPVSALIHAATMVTAGVFLMARMSPFMVHAPNVMILMAWLGAITALASAVMALYQDDLKRVLAYSTASQLGYLFMALGCGVVEDLLTVAVTAAMFHLVTHAFFKALLFLSAGNVMHAMGDVIEMSKFGGLKKYLRRRTSCLPLEQQPWQGCLCWPLSGVRIRSFRIERCSRRCRLRRPFYGVARRRISHRLFDGDLHIKGLFQNVPWNSQVATGGRPSSTRSDECHARSDVHFGRWGDCLRSDPRPDGVDLKVYRQDASAA